MQFQRFQALGVLEGATIVTTASAKAEPAVSSLADEKASEFKIDGPRVRRQPDGTTWRVAVVMAKAAVEGGDVLHVTLWIMRGSALVRVVRNLHTTSLDSFQA